MTTPTQAKVVVAIPSLNTESIIGEVVSKAKKYVNQVIVVNDGSHDNTAREAEASGAMVVNHEGNKGYGEAIKSGFEVAKVSNADILVVLDGDGQHDPNDIPTVLEPILSGKADLVIGSRFLGGKTNIPRYRKFGIQVITFLYNFGSGTKVSDAQSGFRAYEREVLGAFPITESQLGASVEIIIRAREKGFVISEVPISCLYPLAGSSRNPVIHGLKVAFAVVKLRLKSRGWRVSSKSQFDKARRTE